MNNRLSRKNVKDFIEIVLIKGIELDMDIATVWCNGENPVNDTIQAYGIYKDGILTSIMCATFCYMLPTKNSPKGRMCHVSGGFTSPEYRHKGLATTLLKNIENDAKDYFDADYICCDSLADELYIKNGYIYSDEGRLYKRI